MLLCNLIYTFIVVLLKHIHFFLQSALRKLLIVELSVDDIEFNLIFARRYQCFCFEVTFEEEFLVFNRFKLAFVLF